MLEANKKYFQVLTSRNIKPKPIWSPFGRWYNNFIKFNNKQILDFGCSIDSNCYKKFIKDNHNANKSKYLGFDIDQRTVKWLKAKNTFYDFWKDNSLNNKLDIINGSEVYEHLNEKEREDFILRSFDLLSDKGFLLLDFPYMNNFNIIEFFHGDRTHRSVSCEDEAVYIRSLGFKDVEVYIGGLTLPYMSIINNFRYLLLNLITGFYPFHVTLIIARKYDK